ncbi:MAG TPA: uracil-DNA glycosylase family protein, partial [Candidatus Hypogeohydataceae bacterium YC41]
MTYGILTNKVCRSVFEEINNLPYCKACRRARIEFAEKDKKHDGCYSNLLPGFSSEDVEIPIDVLIIGEAHGGGGEEWFREQRRKVYDEVDQLAQYYLAKELENFHQREMRCLFKALNKSGKKWVFTDLIKCFVSNDKVNDKYQKNRREAIKHCRRYLKKQIEVLQPKKILSLGKTVAKKYFNLELGKWKDEHGTIHNCKFPVIVSIFPSKNTA